LKAQYYVPAPHPAGFQASQLLYWNLQEPPYTAQSRHCLDQEFLSFAVKLGGENADASRISIWPSHRVHQSCPNHIVRNGKDRNRFRRILCRANCQVPGSSDDIDS
jgi:hypothetical protein